MQQTRNKEYEQKIIKYHTLFSLITIVPILIISWVYLSSHHDATDRLAIVCNLSIYPIILIICLVLNVGMRRFNACDDGRDGIVTDKIRIH
ncbi:hypothetical protein [Francisella sp. SYW-9]|uniref:hypothetical protein n=1 Tax=Francisella sp. SYW-9 TaxID=2610888 RepID=UPI00123CDD10|nr:hypothetical protein [Francisella sp. SYW-9]